MDDVENRSQLILYQTPDGQQRIEVRLEGETVWLSQVGMAELFQTTKQNISLHLKNIFEEGELSEEATVKDYLTVRTEGNRTINRSIAHYNLEAIIAVGDARVRHCDLQLNKERTTDENLNGDNL